MLLNRLTLMSASGFGLMLALACAEDDVRIDDIPSGQGRGALTAGASGTAVAAPGSAGAEDVASGVGGTGSVALPASVTMTPSGTVLCGSAPCACNNGIDDDGDGTIDGFDIECTGAIDDDEGSFATGIPGDNRDPKWQDCFFDGNSGHGDDRCQCPTECLTGELPLDDD